MGSGLQNAATLRLMSDLREMQKDAPEVSACGPHAAGAPRPPPSLLCADPATAFAGGAPRRRAVR